jgi:hypothetical protein
MLSIPSVRCAPTENCSLTLEGKRRIRLETNEQRYDSNRNH